MSEEILINVAPFETRIAIVEGGSLQEVTIERASQKGIVGNIYKGRVVRVLPGMQAAFVDVGLERAAFLHVSDVVTSRILRENSQHSVPDIAQCVVEGQELVVQVAKEALGSKGARLTMRLSIASRYVVMMPLEAQFGISHRIESEEERERLKSVVQSTSEDPEHGFIIRTAAEGVSDEEIQADVRYLIRRWKKMKTDIQKSAVGKVVFSELPVVERSLRDNVSRSVEKVRIDDKQAFDRAENFVQEFVPHLVGKLFYHADRRPLFDLYGVEDDIQKALLSRVPLKSGGYLIFDQTEALTTIDVNTGGYVGTHDLEETIYRTNLEAVASIGRQLRLRNLGGIIVIDLIDMTDAEHQKQVIRAFEKILVNDSAKTKLCDFSSLGLLEMTRKRTRESLQHVMCEPCPMCEGRGFLKSVPTVCAEIFRDIRRIPKTDEHENVRILASDNVIDRLLDEESSQVAFFEKKTGKRFFLQPEALYTQEQYDIVLT